MVDDYMLYIYIYIYIVLDKIKKIVIEKFDKTTDDKLPDNILKNVVILIIFVIKDDGKLYAQIFLEKILFIK